MHRMASSDPACKLFFSQPRMVEDTLRGAPAAIYEGRRLVLEL